MATLVWLRQDLRVRDNPALAWAVGRGGPVLVCWVLAEGGVEGGDKYGEHPDDAYGDGRVVGGAGRWWLHHSLAALGQVVPLVLRRGDAAAEVRAVAAACGATAVCWNRLYDKDSMARDKALKEQLRGEGLEVQSFNGSLMFEPHEVKNLSGGDFKVFTPFWKACLAKGLPEPLPRPDLREVMWGTAEGVTLASLGLLPTNPDWSVGWEDLWTPGEAGALARLDGFVAEGLRGYKDGRDRADLHHVSKLSPALHWGEVSPRTVAAVAQAAVGRGEVPVADGDKFLAELGWREFAHHLLYHFGDLPTRNWKPAFDAYPWRDTPDDLRAWQRGMTGYPMVDAGMRELWQTGWMHNRVRMITASFLIKHLRIDWRAGERWFWDTLADADVANNAASWQWVAGSGADASPYFRIFNPMLQGARYDPEGAYVRRWCPELALLPTEFIHAPWEAPALVLHAAGVRLGENYPAPMVNHEAARVAAMVGYERVKGASL